ncbi:hypothetical protein NECAME_07338 [Necator americanus]|uniref:Ras family protein n=1 Tax=Necator americanus TaxID=51031 RepID=W2TNA1_NECAM|nr:hypothetical protein NECAME_07338 [Necator americanus]ETN83580.1 hypothetical protein NECAME_07338 [Necator americanus]
MVWHEYKAGTSEQRSELMELWDIGGSGAHRAASAVFLDGAAGVILVHDLSNKKSEENLSQWLSLIDGKPRPLGSSTSRSLLADIESCHVPILTVGCKLDLAPHRGPSAYDRMNINCLRPIPPGSTAIFSTKPSTEQRLLLMSDGVVSNNFKSLEVILCESILTKLNHASHGM